MVTRGLRIRLLRGTLAAAPNVGTSAPTLRRSAGGSTSPQRVVPRRRTQSATRKMPVSPLKRAGSADAEDDPHSPGGLAMSSSPSARGSAAGTAATPSARSDSAESQGSSAASPFSRLARVGAFSGLPTFGTDSVTGSRSVQISGAAKTANAAAGKDTGAAAARDPTSKRRPTGAKDGGKRSGGGGRQQDDDDDSPGRVCMKCCCWLLLVLSCVVVQAVSCVSARSRVSERSGVWCGVGSCVGDFASLAQASTSIS